jgi:phosphomannomutase
MATDSAPQILNSIDTDIISINAQKDANFQTNPLSVKEADIRQMRTLVEANAGSIGISLNRIGTLMRVFDESGEPLSNQHVLALLILFLRPKKIVVPMDISGLIHDVFIGNVNAVVDSPHPNPDPEEMEFILVKPSSENVIKAMKESGAELGYYDGGFIFNNPIYSPDAIHASLIISQFSGMNNMMNIVDSFPEFFTETKSYKFSCSKEDFIRAMNANIQDVNPMKVQEDDCWRIDMNGGAFFVSFDDSQENTVNVVVESNDKVYLISLIEVIDTLIESCANGQ